MGDLKGKLVVVTGASKGFGAAIIAKPMRALAPASGRHTLDRQFH
jgi:NAD(P)-dependent dehydrogenase (short-subunit alcohol dehydrogenase family)